MKYAKAIAAILGGLTPAAVVGILAVFHVNVSQELIAEIYAVGGPVLAGLFTARGPANKVEQAAEAVVEKAAPAVAEVAPVVVKAVEAAAAPAPAANVTSAP